MATLLTNVNQLSTQQVTLLSWLFNHPSLPAARLQHTSMLQLQQQMPASTFNIWQAEMAINPSYRPQLIIQVQQNRPDGSTAPPESVSQSNCTKNQVVAFHGTSFENLHCILHAGMVNVSGLQRNGALFGEGIYLSTAFSVAFSFTHPTPAWQGSSIGSRLRCMLVCSVDKELVNGIINPQVIWHL